jgi:hypothetical protein
MSQSFSAQKIGEGDQSPVLIVAARGLPDRSLRWLRERYGRRRAVVLDLRSSLRGEQLSDGWQLTPERELLDSARLRHEFLAFLDQWPRTPIDGRRSFDELFQQVDGYSLWWTGPGISRQPTRGPLYPSCRALWVTKQAIDRYRPRNVVICARDRRQAAMFASQAQRAGCSWEFAPGSARPARSAWSDQTMWLLGSLLVLAVQPLWLLVRALAARLLAGQPVESAEARERPAVLMTGWYPQHVRWKGNSGEVWYWRELTAALQRICPDVRARYLLHQNRFRCSGWRRVLTPIYNGWMALRRVPHVTTLQQAHPALTAYFRALPSQIAALARYRRLEGQTTFRESFQFAGADVSPLFVGGLRHTLGNMARWARNVDALSRSLAKVGNVKAVLVHEEFYPKGMLTIAAARRLGIATVGVQHGTISPEHLVYCLPAGQIAGSPLPDRFAAYGEFARDVVSRHGHFRPERVWVAGSPRFDHLAGSLSDREDARRRVGLPDDKFIVLLATQSFEWSGGMARALLTAVRDDPDTLVCIKTHPNERTPDRYRALAAECGAQNVCFFRERFDDLLAACDVLVSRSSTTLLEAILAGRPTICVNFPDEPDRYPYVADGGSLGADSAETIHQALDRIRSGDPTLLAQSRQRSLARHVGPSACGASAATLAGMIAKAYLGRQHQSLVTEEAA